MPSIQSESFTAGGGVCHPTGIQTLCHCLLYPFTCVSANVPAYAGLNTFVPPPISSSLLSSSTPHSPLNTIYIFLLPSNHPCHRASFNISYKYIKHTPLHHNRCSRTARLSSGSNTYKDLATRYNVQGIAIVDHEPLSQTPLIDMTHNDWSSRSLDKLGKSGSLSNTVIWLSINIWKEEHYSPLGDCVPLQRFVIIACELEALIDLMLRRELICGDLPGKTVNIGCTSKGLELDIFGLSGNQHVGDHRTPSYRVIFTTTSETSRCPMIVVIGHG